MQRKHTNTCRELWDNLGYNYDIILSLPFLSGFIGIEFRVDIPVRAVRPIIYCNNMIQRPPSAMPWDVLHMKVRPGRPKRHSKQMAST